MQKIGWQFRVKKDGWNRGKKIFRTRWMLTSAAVLSSVLLWGCQSGADEDRSAAGTAVETAAELTTEMTIETGSKASAENTGVEGDSLSESAANAESSGETDDDRGSGNEQKVNEAAQADYILPDSDTKFLEWDDVKDLSQEELRIARNEIYARHGRRFKAQDLQEYFDGRSWYQGQIEADQFREDQLNSCEKRNIRFLKGLEPVAGLPGLSEAPSKAVMDRYGYENGHSVLSFDFKEGTAKDCGEYYEVEAVYCQGIEAPGDLKYGDRVTLVFNELTGEKKTLEYRQGGLYPVNEGQYAAQYYYTPTQDKRPVVLYQDSDDRVDKPVYEGKLYIRRDASREIDIVGQSEPVTSELLNREYNWYNGVFFDEKGYVVRLVVYGD